jgi:hypothetical protein
MRPLLKAHPRTAPAVAALIVMVLAWLFSVFENRSPFSVALESLLMGMAMYFLVKSLRSRDP